MFRNIDLFDIPNNFREYFDDESYVFNAFNSDTRSPRLTNFDEIEIPDSLQSLNLFGEDDSIIPFVKNTSLDYGTILNNNFGMDQENQINPPMTGAFSTDQAQSQVIDVEESQNESQESKETKNTRTQEEAQKKISTDSQRAKQNQMSGSKKQENSMEQIFDQIGQQNSSDSSQKSKKNLPHLRMDRRTKGKRNHLQQEVKGYWTNNLLRWAKKYHLDWILDNYGQRFLKQHQEVYKVFNKVCNKTGKKMEGINMADYVTIYEEKDLRKAWSELFSKKVLYRELMLSKTDAKVKKVYAKFMSNFERAFRTKRFEFLSKTEEEHQNM